MVSVPGIHRNALAALACVVLAALPGRPAWARDFKVEDVPSVTAVAPASLKPDTIVFSDGGGKDVTDAKSGLVRFADWAKTKPLQKEFLCPYPGYEEPTLSYTRGGSVKKATRRLHMYVAEARFALPRAPQAIDLKHYMNVAFLERMDPVIKHQLINSGDVTPNSNTKLANHHPTRRWCESSASTAVPSVCIKSRYKLEGKLPTAILLLNKLRESGKTIADFIEFESELRIIPPDEIDQSGLSQLTGIATPVAAALEQNIVNVNQVMQFGKFLALLQADPANANRTIVTAFVALAVESDLFEKRKEFENVPVLRNMVPAQVLSGNSSFNTGESISAGLPNYARNRIKALATVLRSGE
ncbi:MAG: hypothetical protein R3D62_20080 [Xanthobacteraceae bacterium]